MTGISKNPNVVGSEEEEEQMLKAIELYLEDSGSPRNTVVSNTIQSTSMYHSVKMEPVSTNSASAAKEPCKDRALYGFEAAKTFTSSVIILVLDDSVPNRWKDHRGEGLFPANLITVVVKQILLD